MTNISPEHTNRLREIQATDERLIRLAGELSALEEIASENIAKRESFLKFVDRTPEIVSWASFLLLCLSLSIPQVQASKDEIRESLYATGMGSVLAGILSKIASSR